MGTSSWQNIPFCVDVLMKIEPTRVLDIGVGFGRWGMLVREFCDVWFGRVFRSDWKVWIEGVEGFSQNIDDYHRFFYNRIRVADFQDIYSELIDRWNVIIFGDVLEHFEKKEAIEILNWALSNSDYVLVNIPLGENWEQNEMYGNILEKHLSTWSLDDFKQFHLCRQALYFDYINRPFGSFVLSKEDPKEVAKSLFSKSRVSYEPAMITQYSQTESEVAITTLQEQIFRVEALINELQEIKASRGYKFIQRLKQTSLAPLFRSFLSLFLPNEESRLRRIYKSITRKRLSIIRRRASRVPPGKARIYPLDQCNPQSGGKEVWLLAVNPHKEPPTKFNKIHTYGRWELKENQATPTGHCLECSTEGIADIPAEDHTRLRFMKHPWSGVVEIIWKSQKYQVDLYSPTTQVVEVDVSSGIIPSTKQNLTDETGKAQTNNIIPPVKITNNKKYFSAADQVWIQKVSETPKPVSIIHPNWLGIRSSAASLFDYLYEIDDNLDKTSGEYFAKLIIQSGCPCVVIQGFPLTYIHIVNSLNRIEPLLPVYIIWHGNFLHTSEDYAWEGFKIIRKLCLERKVKKLGFVKKGMAEVMASTGLPTGFILNMIRDIPQAASIPLPGGPNFGIWLIQDDWKKLPYSMLAASSLINGATVYLSGANTRVEEFAQLMGLRVVSTSKSIQRQALLKWMSQMHLNLYVTLTECAPMVPLECLSVGSPCLLGPNSHLFRDDSYLHSRLVVPYPDSADSISEYIVRALNEREKIIDAYRSYAPGYNARARAALAEFLEVSETVL